MVLVLEQCRGDIPAMQDPAEAAAKRLAEGGRLFAAGQPSMVSELCGRAGGIMMIRRLGDTVPEGNDVVLFFPETAQGALEASNEALVVRFGQCPADSVSCFPNHAEECGVSPTLANAAPGWLFTGELVAALTRLGKMPVIYETIGGYGGFARIQQYENGRIGFHEEHVVKPVAPGVLGGRYADALTGMLGRVAQEQGGNLEKAAAWAREAQAADKQRYMYSMGHLFPAEVKGTAIGEVFQSAVWNAGFRNPKPDHSYAPGDVAVLIGYQHPPDVLLRRARPAGAKVAYLAVRGDRDFVADEGVVWIDPMWDWPDACVSLEGYDVPLLAASGIMNGAIAWEIYRLTVR